MGKLRHNEETHLTGRVGEGGSGPGSVACDQRALAFGKSLRFLENVTDKDVLTDSPFTVTFDPRNVSIWGKINENKH